MRISWRQVSALLVLLALIAAACSSSPAEVIIGDDGAVAEEDAADEAQDEPGEDVATAGAAMDSIADDSAPRVAPSARQEQMLDAFTEARIRWAATGIEDYDFTMLSSSERPTEDGPLSDRYEITVRGGEVIRVIPEDDFRSDLGDFTIAVILGDLQRAIENEDGFAVDFDGKFGFPERIRGQDSQAGGFVVHIENFRVPGDYPERCSTSGLSADELQASTDNVAVNATRSAIFVALAECDFLMLSHLANSGEWPLTTSDGTAGVELIWQAESRGEPVMMNLFEVLLRDSETTNDLTVWPSEYAEPDSEYLGWRAGINAEGEWMFFVGGD